MARTKEQFMELREEHFWNTKINPITGWIVEPWFYTEEQNDERRERQRRKREY